MPTRFASTRPRKPRRLSPRCIVVCEGRKTEYNYFTLLNATLKGSQRAAFSFLRGKGGTAIDVVRQAVQKRNDDKRDGRFAPRDGDRVYAVIDVEPHDSTKVEPLKRALALASKHDVTVLLSNPSFEVWLLCHVSTAVQMKRRFATPGEVDELLKKRFGKGKDELNTNPHTSYGRLAKMARDAILVAQEVHHQHHGGCDDLRDANACTEVYRLVEYMLGQTDSPP